MTDDPFDGDARALATAFWRRLRDAGAPTPEVLARELVHMAKGHGWRPVEALAKPAEASSPTPGPPEDYLASRAALDTRPLCTCTHAVLQHANVCGTREACSQCGCTAYTPSTPRSESPR